MITRLSIDASKYYCVNSSDRTILFRGVGQLDIADITKVEYGDCNE